jgi:hypothetical protein
MTTDYYTFMYCMIHDDGFIIRGNHLYAPDGYSTQHCDKCESCDWYNMGVIKYNGSSFDIVENMRVDYDRYGGGFMFIGYTDTLTDEKGATIENEELNKWIEYFPKKI